MFSQLSTNSFKIDVPSRWFKLINFFAFQITWGFSVFGRENWVLVSVLILLCHFALSPSKKQDLATVALVATGGIAMDALLSFFDIFLFANQELMPLWLVMLWIAFALTLNHSMFWLLKLRVEIQCLLGSIGGSFSYWMGYNFGAVDFSLSTLITVGIMLVAWCIAFPLFCFLVKRYVFRT